jgi:crotonobetainyl-CoA:carnitine CoA-transferase CaiB-like acyl-CoA transferase
MKGPLAGIRVLDFTIAQQGPYATALLSDLGAEVIKVEQPGQGEVGRTIARDPETRYSYYFLAINRGKKGITVDLKSAKGRELVLRLARDCDVVVENFRPGVMERLGLGYEAFRAVNPGIIYASASAFGRRGRWGRKPGNDILAQAAKAPRPRPWGWPSPTTSAASPWHWASWPPCCTGSAPAKGSRWRPLSWGACSLPRGGS